MTPDQVYFRLCDRDVLKAGKRTKTVPVGGVPVDKDGFIKARDKDGNPIKLRMSSDGKSLCQRLQEQEQAKVKQEKEKQGRRRRKRGS